MSVIASSSSRRSYVITLSSIVALTIAVAAAISGVPLWEGAEQLARPLAIWLIIFFSAAVSSIVGFAFSAIAGAILFHFVSSGVEAVQIMMIASIGIQSYTLAVMYRSIRWTRCLPFLAGGVAATPLGVVLLFALPPTCYLLAIGIMLIAYGGYMQFRRPSIVAGEHKLIDLAAGAAGGITGPLAAFPAPCLVIWCNMRGWDKLEQRAVYQPYILVMQVVALALLVMQRPGSVDPSMLAYVIPGAAGAVIGVSVFRALSDLSFHRAINVALVVSGAALMLK